MLVRLFDSDAEAKKVIDKISLGAEKTIFNIPLKHRAKIGKADSQFNNVIIEFEKDLSRTGQHAKEQLIEYLAGNWKSGADYNFTLIASDGVEWVVYAPLYEKLIYKKVAFSVADIELKPIVKFVLSPKNYQDFFYFLDRFLFKTSPIPATLENITIAFGGTLAVYINAMKKMKEYLPSLKGIQTVETAYDQ